MAGLAPIAGGESSKDHANRQALGVDHSSLEPFGSSNDTGQTRDSHTDHDSPLASSIGKSIRETDQNVWRRNWQDQDNGTPFKTGGRAEDVNGPQTAGMGDCP
jgi:hypothetical protein